MSAELVIQGGNLVLLAFVLAGLYRLALRFLPLVRDLVRVLSALEEGMAEVKGEIGQLRGRGICPLLERRAEVGQDGGPATEPEVAA